MSAPSGYEVVAFNTATASTNKIHDDEVARTYGFRGGLVPGVDVYAYLTHVPVERWGRRWLEDGHIAARFISPVYDGDGVTVSGQETDVGLDLTLTDSARRTCATATASLGAHPIERPVPGPAQLPGRRPPASADTLPAGTVLGSLTDVFDAAAAATYLADVRETVPVYVEDAVAHPGWLLRFANSILSRNVELGPWIHVSSDVALLGLVHDGDPLDVRAVVLDELQRKGHRFVVLDVSITSDGRSVQRITHTAIHTPRRAT